MRVAVLVMGASCALGGGCADDSLPRMPEVLVIVDTDLPVPHAASRLRVDLYDESGRWFESRDFARPTPEDWPASFGVHVDDPDRASVVWVRARVYPEGGVRDYLGERFVDLGGSLAPPPGDRLPRLVVDGVDRTPSSEPQPFVTVDRLFGVRLEPRSKHAVRILLAGACAGTMTKLAAIDGADDRIDPSGTSSCIDASRVREPAAIVAGEPPDAPPETRAGSWGSEGPCAPGDSTPDRVCVPSGVLVMGDARLLETPYIPSTPERTFHVSRFWIDRHEVSVGRYRAAVASGFAPKRPPTAYEQPITTWTTSTCTWSRAPLGREDLPMTCIGWNAARSFCRAAGGDLPTEAQWEYAATAAERRYEAHFPWGDDDPACKRAVYERLPVSYPGCIEQGAPPGPQPVSSLEGDVNPLGIMGLAGNVTEWTRDAFTAYVDPCWGKATIDDPVCESASPPARALRGGSWASPLFFVRGAMRQGHADAPIVFEGFRCVYAGP